MDSAAVLAIISRWIHIVAACLAVGGIFFVRVIIPAGLAELDEPTRKTTYLRLRRFFKIVIHSAILLFILSGAYNSYLAWNVYSRDPAAMHSLWGTHVLLALIVFVIALYLLSGKALRKRHVMWMTLNLLLLLIAIAAASALRWVRERSMTTHPEVLQINPKDVTNLTP